MSGDSVCIGIMPELYDICMVKSSIALAFVVASTLILSVNGCRSNKRPKNVLSQTQMVSVLKDFYVTEQKLQSLVQQPDSAKQDFAYISNKILSSRNIDDSTFRLSYNYYMEHPDQLDQVYTSLIDSLTLMMERYRTR